jgi:flagellar assembly factor FliW
MRKDAMEIPTSRFGPIEIAPADVIQFPAGLPGLDDCTTWVLLADAHNDALGWLQSTTHPDVALAVVSPRRFVPDYQLRVTRGELGSLLCQLIDDVHVLAIVGKNECGITLNLKAPLVIHLCQRIGRQVVASGDQPVQYELRRETPLKRKIA